VQERAREPRRAKHVVEVVWNPFVGFNVDERITEVSKASEPEGSFGETAMKACDCLVVNGGHAPPSVDISTLNGPSSDSVTSNQHSEVSSNVF
jgi:hypothetical protein